MTVHIAQPVQGPGDWDINKDAFLPPHTHRVVRGWDRAPASGHGPRLHGKTVWKKFLPKAFEFERNEDNVQEELEKAGTGARKKLRIIGAKENINDAIWDETQSPGRKDRSPDDVQPVQKRSLVSPEIPQLVRISETASEPKADAENSELSNSPVHFVPRKRTNTNHVITPRKPLRQSTLDIYSHRKSLSRFSISHASNSSRPHKSIRKSSRRSTLVNDSRSESKTMPLVSTDLETPENHTAEVSQTVDLQDNFTGSSTLRSGLRRSTRLARSSIMSADASFDTKSLSSESLGEEFTFTANASTEAISFGDGGSSMVKIPGEVEEGQSSDVKTNDPTVMGIEPLIEQLPVDFAKKEESAELTDVAVTLSLKDDGPVSHSLEAVADVEITDEQEKQEIVFADISLTKSGSTDRLAKLEGNIDVEKIESVKIVVASPALTSVTDPDLPEPDLTVQDLPTSVSAESNQQETSPDMESMGQRVSPIKNLDSTISEIDNENLDEIERPDLITSDLIETISKNSPVATHYDHDDTDMLRNFLTRVQANKAAKRTSPRRKRSLPHSPLRIPLGDVDHNLSPSLVSNSNALATSEGSPTKRWQGNPLVFEDEVPDTRSCRRSGRTRLPVKSQTPSGAPSFIPMRRLGQDSDTTVTLRRNEEKELAALTRVNTRKNKAGALPALDVLAKKAEEKEDPVMRQKLLKEVFDEKKAKQDKKSKGKSVAWAEKLAQFQEAKNGNYRARKMEKQKESVATPGEEKKQGAVRVGVRSKVALGMAMNGTPAPKRTMRSRH